MTRIKLNPAEIASKHTRVNWAEHLILQLPKEHEGRKSWLLNYGVSKEAIELRNRSLIAWSEETTSAANVGNHKFFSLNQIESSDIKFWHKQWSDLTLSEKSDFAVLVDFDNTENGHLKSLYDAYRMGRATPAV